MEAAALALPVFFQVPVCQVMVCSSAEVYTGGWNQHSTSLLGVRGGGGGEEPL